MTARSEPVTAPAPRSAPAPASATPSPAAYVSTFRESINPASFAVGVFLMIVLTKLTSYLTPYKLYFSFSSFLYSERALFRWEALALKLLVPCLVGFLLYYFPLQWMRITAGSRISYRALYRYLALQADTTARAAGFFGSLLLAWPFIVYWDVLMAPTLQHLRFPFFVVYLLYFISFTYFASLGVALAQFVGREQLPDQVGRQSAMRLGWINTVRTSVLGLVTSGIATYFAGRLGSAP